jgi:hypothetical protein
MTNLELADQIEALVKAATPGEWGEDYAQSGQPGTQIALVNYDWKEAIAGERWISLKEAEANAALIVTLRNNAETLIAALRENERLREALEEENLTDAIDASLDEDWQPRDAARLIRQRAALKNQDHD